MPSPFAGQTINPAFVQHVFAYQQTKRLHFLIDQILWSVDQIEASAEFSAFHPYIRQMITEAKDHVTCLDQKPV